MYEVINEGIEHLRGIRVEENEELSDSGATTTSVPFTEVDRVLFECRYRRSRMESREQDLQLYTTLQIMTLLAKNSPLNHRSRINF